MALALRVARRSRRVIKHNIVLSLGLKLAFLALAIPGIATLWMAVLADVGATLLVTLNGMRLLSKNDEPACGHFGPNRFTPGVSPRHVICFLFAALISIGVFTYLVALTPYVLSVNLGLPESEHGRVIGDLQFWQEIVVITTIGRWGAMSDRLGRRTAYIGFPADGGCLRIYAFATSLPQLFAYRMVFALAVAATTTISPPFSRITRG